VIRLVAIDVDGTLLDSHGRVPGENLEALAEAARRGVHLAVVTGRSYPFALQAVETLPDPLTMVVYNGAVVRQRGGSTLAVRPLEHATARLVLEATRPWRESTLMQFNRDGAGQTMVDRLSWDPPNRRGYYERIRHLVRVVDDLEGALDADAPVQVAFNGPIAEMDVLATALRGLDLGGRACVALTAYPARDFALVDVNAAGATKGQALADLARHLGVGRDEVFAIGDNHNDIDMLQWAGTAVVMGNAEPEVLALGLPVTASNDEAGLSRALWQYVLGPGGSG
jgi:hydroxymethylpyrimidine pyrophosphatase-like HAD family hydrolase